MGANLNDNNLDIEQNGLILVATVQDTSMLVAMQ